MSKEQVDQSAEEKAREALASSDAAAMQELSATLKEVDVQKEQVPPAAKEEDTKPKDKEEAPAPPVPSAPERPEDKIAPRPYAKSDTVRDFDALKAIIGDERKKSAESEQKLKETEAKLTSLEEDLRKKAITPEIEAELTDLRELRRTHYIENDPEFQAKYSNKLKEVDEKAINILKARALQPAMEKYIREQGGVVAMYGSEKPMVAPYESQTQREFILDTLLPKLDAIQQGLIHKAIGDGVSLREEMTREIEHAKTHGSELQKKKAEDMEKAFMDSAMSERTKLGKRAEKWDIPKDASKEEKTRIEKHNARVENAEKLFKAYMQDGSRNPAKLAEAILKASYSQFLMEEAEEKDVELADREQKINDLKERLSKVKGSAATGKQSSAPPPSSLPPPDRLMTDAEALDQAFGKK